MNWLLLEVSIVLILAVIIVVSTLPKKRKVPPPSDVSATASHNSKDESKV